MFNILKDPSIRVFLVLAILVRLLIIPFYFHPDIKTYNFQASFLKQGVWNIYDYLAQHKRELPLKDEFVYFPLTYFTLGAYQVVITPILGPGFNQWLTNAGSSASSDIGVFKFLFFLKLHYLLLDILIGVFLASLFVQEQAKKKALIFWLLNPFSVILLYIYSNVDIFPVALVVLSLYFARKDNFILSALMLGLGAGFKAFPILLVPFLLLKAVKLRDKAFVLLFSLGPFLLTLLPFIKSSAFRESTLVSGLTTRIISSGIDIGFNEMLMPTIVLLSFLFFWGGLKSKIELWRLYLSAFLMIFVSIHFHIQWLFWAIPLFAILYASEGNQEKKLSILFLSIAFIIPLLYSDKFMSVGVMKAISPLFELLPTPQLILSKVYEPTVVQGVLHSILFGLGVVLIINILNKK